MIDLDKLRESKGYMLAIVNTKTGEYEPVNEDVTQVIRCKDCRYYDVRAKTMDTLCTRKQGCRETIPEGFCGWAIPKMDEVENDKD